MLATLLYNVRFNTFKAFHFFTDTEKTLCYVLKPLHKNLIRTACKLQVADISDIWKYCRLKTVGARLYK